MAPRTTRVGVAAVGPAIAVHVPVAAVGDAVPIHVPVAAIRDTVAVDVPVPAIGDTVAVDVPVAAVRNTIAVDIAACPRMLVQHTKVRRVDWSRYHTGAWGRGGCGVGPRRKEAGADGQDRERDQGEPWARNEAANPSGLHDCRLPFLAAADR
jgi:hypothetical protein